MTASERDDAAKGLLAASSRDRDFDASRRRQLTADAALLLVTLIWGSTFVMVKNAVASFPVFSFLALRFAFAALALLPFVVLRQRNARAQVLGSRATPSRSLPSPSAPPRRSSSAPRRRALRRVCVPDRRAASDHAGQGGVHHGAVGGDRAALRRADPAPTTFAQRMARGRPGGGWAGASHASTRPASGARRPAGPGLRVRLRRPHPAHRPLSPRVTTRCG